MHGNSVTIIRVELLGYIWRSLYSRDSISEVALGAECDWRRQQSLSFRVRKLMTWGSGAVPSHTTCADNDRLFTDVTNCHIRIQVLESTGLKMYKYPVRFQLFTLATIKVTALWDITQCSLVELERRFRRAYCLLNQGNFPDDGEAARTSETADYFHETTWCYIPESCQRIHILSKKYNGTKWIMS
jgi:hypothetical protein